MKFELSGKAQELIINENVISHFYRHRQIKFWHKEAGGQLFAKIEKKRVIVDLATGPHRKDLRSVFGFIPNKKRLISEINQLFNKGFHYVGDWHTHPQDIPKPSQLDINSMRSCFQESTHELEYFIMIIVGRNLTNDGLWISLLNDSELIDLSQHNQMNRKS
ncbi:Mov34/MPN/PAD-1 family protein [Desulfospira joergensenii]|uniref:Mov34/MPN/PAD-1 family protein n=1 Tax=Desulfospira joergensenii TaxID=53329 RepID=UPI0003B4039C|nr:Mov34/MPN/PAD-1 family protein [Desulfospira joergensenii]